MEFSSNLSAIYTKWCAQTFLPIFGLFAIFDRNFAKIVASCSDECENSVVHLKEQSSVKKMLKTVSKSACKRQRNSCSNYAPLRRTVLRSRSVIDKLETKASSHEGQCIPAGYCHTNAHYACGVNNYLNSNHTKYLAQLCGRFFAFLTVSAANLRTLWRHLPTELRNV